MSFNDFKKEDGAEPVDGEHTAWLERTSVFEARSGQWFIRTCWRTTDMNHYWETLNGTEGNSKPRTQQLLEKIGINLGELRDWDDLGDQLVAYENRAYIVKVGRRGEYLNTAIIDTPQGVQDELRPDTTGLPAARTTFRLPDTAAPPAAAAGGGMFDETSAAALAAIDPTPVPTGGKGGLFDDDDVPF